MKRFYVEAAGGGWWVVRDRQAWPRWVAFRYHSRDIARAVSGALNAAQARRDREAATVAT